MRRGVAAALLWLACAALPAAAQAPAASTRTVEALGLETRVMTVGLEDRREGEPGMMPWVMASGTWWSHVMIVHR